MALHVHLTKDGGVFINHNRDEKRGRDAGPNLSGYSFSQLEPMAQHLEKMEARGEKFRGPSSSEFRSEIARRKAAGPDQRRTMKNFRGEEVENPMFGKYR